MFIKADIESLRVFDEVSGSYDVSFGTLSFSKDILFCACSSVISSMTPFDLWFPRGPAVAGNQRVHGKG
jgi:hypothetical protein